MKFFKIICLLFVMSTKLLGQEVEIGIDSCDLEIKGQIIDKETGMPIPFATLHTETSHHTAVSDENGNYTIFICDGERIGVSCIGYDNCSHEHHTHSHNHHIIELQSSALLLSEVVISVKHEAPAGVKTLSTQNVSKELLESGAVSSLGQALERINGLHIISNGANVELPVIHGLYGNRIAILNNGFKHGFQNWGIDHAPEIDMDGVENIKVIKGAAAVRFGAESIGGVVEVETNSLQLNQPLFGVIGLGAQSNGRGGRSHFSIHQGKSSFAWSLKGSLERSGDKKAPDYYLSNSGKSEWGIGGGFRLHKNKIDARISYNYVNQNLGLYRTAIAESADLFIRSIDASTPLYTRPFSYDIQSPRQPIDHHLLTGELSYWLNDESRLILKAGQQINNRQEFDVRRDAGRPIIDLSLYTSDLQLTWKHSEWKGFRGDIGGQLFYQDNNNNPGTGTTAFIPNYNTTRWSAYMVEVLDLGNHNLELGLRVDSEYNSVRGRTNSQDLFLSEYRLGNVSATIGYMVDLGDDLTLKTNIASAWRTPNMAELYSFGQRGFKTQYGLLRYQTEGNGINTNEVLDFERSDIQPEKAWKWVGEASYQKGNSDILITGYFNWINDFVYQRPYGVIGSVRGPTPYFIYEQTNAFFIGGDLTYRYAFHPNGKLELGASYLFSKSRERNAPLVGQPPGNVNCKLEWSVPFKGWKGTIFMRNQYVFKQYYAPDVITVNEIVDGTALINEDTKIFDFVAAPKGYFLTDLGWQLEKGKWSASLICQNAYNQKYRNYLNGMRYFTDDLGRNIILKLNYKI